MGLDVGRVVGRSDLAPRPGKVQHAFCIDVDRTGDVRVLSNNTHRANAGPRRCCTSSATPCTSTASDATCRGCCGRCTSASPKASPCAAAASCTIRNGCVGSPAFPAATVAELAPRLRGRQPCLPPHVRPLGARDDPLRARPVRQPDGDHDDRWWDLVERFQLVRRPDDRHAPDWAAKIHIAAAPVYYHNYLFGEMVASQLTARSAARRTTAAGPRSGHACSHRAPRCAGIASSSRRPVPPSPPPLRSRLAS